MSYSRSPSKSKFSKSLLVITGIAAIAPLGILVASEAHDHGGHGGGIYETRHEGYEKLGDAFKVIRDQTKAGSPDVAAIRTAAKVVHDTSVEQYKWFPKDSGPKAGVKTRAKAEIWSKPADFEKAQKAFSAEAVKLDTVAKAGDVAAIGKQFGETGKTCKGCHDTFRAPEKD